MASGPLKDRWCSEGEKFCARSRNRTGGRLAGFVEDSATKRWRKRSARSSRPVFRRAARRGERPRKRLSRGTRKGVDVTLIRWMARLTPTQRLAVLQDYVNLTTMLRRAATTD